MAYCERINKYPIIIGWLLVITFSQCTVANRQVVGTYIDKKGVDTLQINKDHSYMYSEKLVKGNLGYTTGTWAQKNKQLHFTCNRQVLVGYQLRLQSDTSVKQFKIRLLLNDTDEPIDITSVKLIQNNLQLSDSNFITKKNILTLNNTHFDSMIIHTDNFVPLVLPGSLNSQHGYIARIFPIEILYKIDKVPFSIRKRGLFSKKTKEFPRHVLTFKRIADLEAQ
ncbi:MAG: hypothetical protein KGK14_00900 [Bacteroidota bacterium]|jgi:hypothetical protein|nr:hypothetical protein [Bacteroidota bacterium]